MYDCARHTRTMAQTDNIDPHKETEEKKNQKFFSIML